MLYVVLLLLVVWHLGGRVLKATYSLRPGAASYELVSQVDSFSQPSIAAAILKRETDHLFWAYAENRNRALELEVGRVQENTAGKNQQLPGQNQLSLHELKHVALASAPMQDIERLHATLQELTIDFDRQLMATHFTNESWNEFLDCYLRLLVEAPEKVNALWTRAALEYSQQCHRTEEMVGALEHFLRYHPQLKAARALESTLQEWNTNHLANLRHVNQ